MEHTEKKELKPLNAIIISVEDHIQNEVKFDSGTKLFIDPTYNPHNFAITKGIIKHSSFEHLPVGAEVVFHKSVTLKRNINLKNLSMGEGLVDDEQKLYFIDYYFRDKENTPLLLVKKDKEWKNVNQENSIYEPIPYEEIINQGSLLFLNDKGHEGKKNKYKVGVAKLKYPSLNYKKEHTQYHSNIDFSIQNDKEITVFDPDTGYLIQVDDKEMLVVPDRRILGSISEKDIDKINFPKKMKR